MGCSAHSPAASACSTMTITTSMVTLSASASTSLLAPAPGLPNTSNTLSVPKPPAQRPPHKTWTIPYLTPAPISPPIHSDWSSDEDWDSTKERERISKVIRRKNRKVAEEESRKKAKERTLSCVPDLLGDTPNLLPANSLAPALKTEKATREAKKSSNRLLSS